MDMQNIIGYEWTDSEGTVRMLAPDEVRIVRRNPRGELFSQAELDTPDGEHVVPA